MMSKLNLYNLSGTLEYTVDVSKEIDRGGEGVIVPHPTNKNLVLKIYHAGITPGLTSESWAYLAKLDNRFIKPLELFYNSTGALIGFSMELLDKSFFRIAQIFTKSQCNKLGIVNATKNVLSKELASVVEEAHDKEIVIGDFNPYNIFINSKAELKILDVDSFETPAQKHSGRLLEDIRDHYNLGRVNRESDYYALAVNIFRLLTFVHPYKGVHNTCKQLEERAIKRISLLGSDTGLIIPAFYEPIGNSVLEAQFKRIFEDGERFLIRLDNFSTVKKQQPIRSITPTAVTVKIIANNVLDFYFNEKVGYVKTTVSTDFYECLFNGSLNLTDKIINDTYNYLWVGDKNILRVMDGVLYQNKNAIINFELPENLRFIQIDHIVFGVDSENIYQIYPDKIVNNNVDWNKRPSWGRGFKFDDSPIQYTGGVVRTHYRNGDTINTVKLPINPKTLVIKGNIGVVSYLANEKIIHQWFLINGLNFELCNVTEEIFSFAVKQTLGSSFVFVPKDGTIDILRVPDFIQIDSIDFNVCTSQSQIALTRSGLLLLENNILYLINRK